MGEVVIAHSFKGTMTSIRARRKRKQLAGDASKESNKKKGETSSAFLPFSNVHAELWKPIFSIVELGKEVTVADFVKDHDTSLALVQASCRTPSWDLHGGWLACLSELGIPKDNPSWVKAAHEAKLPKSPKRYSPLIPPDYNEEEYMNQLAKEAYSHRVRLTLEFFAKSQSLFALGVFEVVSAIIGDLNYLVWSFPIWVGLPVSYVLVHFLFVHQQGRGLKIDLQRDYNFESESPSIRRFVCCFPRCFPIGPQNVCQFLDPFAFGLYKPLPDPLLDYFVGGLGLPIALRVARC
ncbi:hypothetical protein Acr_00g0021780 [Actinidia rufa]|uniref:Transmembrane protein n=1 Tax=Actinidia rufa TaxID=165716 RepID=A0A7J0DCM5_9ERIC|nr:hypothetical protein Acr_00g0021780 [Actinidia rufa]